MQGLDAFTVIFVNDILVFSKNVKDHATHLKKVIDTLTKANLRLRVEKCHFCYKKIALLGHILTKDSQEIDPSKVSNFMELPRPITGKQVESYLGLASYLRDYIPMYARIAAPLEALRKVKKITDDLWTKNCQEAFDIFKKVLSAPPILSMPLDVVLFSIRIDTSKYKIGAILYQKTNQGKRFICFASKALNKSQSNYPATKKELLAIMFALQKFRPWIYGRHFTLYSNHRALSFLLTQKQENAMLRN